MICRALISVIVFEGVGSIVIVLPFVCNAFIVALKYLCIKGYFNAFFKARRGDMGVRKFGKKWRGVASVSGVMVSNYFNAQEQAELFCLSCEKINAIDRPAWASTSKKRSGAADPSLPIGFFETYDVKKLKGGVLKEYRFLKCVFVKDGKKYSSTKSFGKSRGRDDALTELLIVVAKKFENLN